MFQLAFGLSPLQSGSLLLVYMAANLLTKLITNPIMRRFGIRTVLISTGVMAGISIACCAFVSPGSYPLLNGLILAAAGAGRSLQLTAITMVNFADIGPAQRQPASVFSSLTQQIGMGAGVAVGALLLTSSQSMRGADVLALQDFRVAFILAGALSILAVFLYMTLARGVGDEISGHGRAKTHLITGGINLGDEHISHPDESRAAVFADLILLRIAQPIVCIDAGSSAGKVD